MKYNTAGTRIDWIDICKFLAITIMCLGHKVFRQIFQIYCIYFICPFSFCFQEFVLKQKNIPTSQCF